MPGHDLTAAYDTFSVPEWSALRADVGLELSEADIETMRGLGEQIRLPEVESIYLPLARLLNIHVLGRRELRRAKSEFLRNLSPSGPFLVGLAGSVAVGKSTTSRVLSAVLSQWSEHERVSVVTTDGFLRSNAWLEENGMMHRKGFPESYDVRRLVAFLAALKAGCEHVDVPVYSHEVYDVVPGVTERIIQPDIVIVEGLNVLQVDLAERHGEPRPQVSDFFDFSIYIDAEEKIVRRWYVDRFLQLRDSARHESSMFFHRFRSLNDDDATMFAERIWDSINGPNLRENIRPTRNRADLILTKNPDHSIGSVQLRRH